MYVNINEFSSRFFDLRRLLNTRPVLTFSPLKLLDGEIITMKNREDTPIEKK